MLQHTQLFLVCKTEDPWFESKVPHQNSSAQINTYISIGNHNRILMGIFLIILAFIIGAPIAGFLLFQSLYLTLRFTHWVLLTLRDDVWFNNLMEDLRRFF